MELKPSNNNILEQLRNGFARFELVSSPTSSVSESISSTSLPATFLGSTQGNSYVFFAKIGSSMNRSPAAKKVEQYAVNRVKGDGRCLFRALVKGMAFNKGLTLNPRTERDDADELRMAVKEVICNDPKEREMYKEALVAITVDESLKRYCQRIGRHDFWGGESELLVLSKLCKQPIIVYIPEHEHGRGGYGSGYIPIQEYGSEFRGGWGKGKTNKNVVRLLYSGFRPFVEACIDADEKAEALKYIPKLSDLVERGEAYARIGMAKEAADAAAQANDGGELLERFRKTFSQNAIFDTLKMPFQGAS